MATSETHQTAQTTSDPPVLQELTPYAFVINAATSAIEAIPVPSNIRPETTTSSLEASTSSGAETTTTTTTMEEKTAAEEVAATGEIMATKETTAAKVIAAASEPVTTEETTATKEVATATEEIDIIEEIAAAEKTTTTTASQPSPPPPINPPTTNPPPPAAPAELLSDPDITSTLESAESKGECACKKKIAAPEEGKEGSDNKPGELSVNPKMPWGVGAAPGEKKISSDAPQPRPKRDFWRRVFKRQKGSGGSEIVGKME